MTDEPKPPACPFCNGTRFYEASMRYCAGCGASVDIRQWQNRPIEDALQARIAELEAENTRIKLAIVDKCRDETELVNVWAHIMKVIT